ncbi:MAG: hypothetical protein WDW38_005295 [Sanguina aurantia]
MSAFLDSLKWDNNGLIAVVAQHVDTGECLMQAFADRAAINETMQTKLATFYSRSRKGRWCKGETSGHFIKVMRVFLDCDRDSIVYLSEPIGPACHTGARSCWFSEVSLAEGGSLVEAGSHDTSDHMALTTLYALEATIAARHAEAGHVLPAGTKPSWTARLLADPVLLCKKVREEAGELCETLEKDEGKERAASEAADMLYHAMVLLRLQDVPMDDVMKVLRKRVGISGVEERASRKPKSPPAQ